MCRSICSFRSTADCGLIYVSFAQRNRGKLRVLVKEVEMTLRDNLLSNLRGLLEETERLIQEVSHQSEAGVVTARDRARHAVERARQDLGDYAHAGLSRARDAGMAADRYVHDHAWSFMAAAALVALAIGALLVSHGHRESGEGAEHPADPAR
jgi:ElaB/YqjD/DUF883 family membrane-anchored ribosome-binding protein